MEACKVKYNDKDYKAIVAMPELHRKCDSFFCDSAAHDYAKALITGHAQVLKLERILDELGFASKRKG